MAIERKTWKEFSDVKLLWWVNRILHTFGWSIVLEVEENGDVSGAYPARTDWLGFLPDIDDAGLIGFRAHIATGMDSDEFARAVDATGHGWIPVGDSLPDADDWYLVVRPQAPGTVVLSAWDGAWTGPVLNPSHWRPLPDPPRGV